MELSTYVPFLLLTFSLILREGKGQLVGKKVDASVKKPLSFSIFLWYCEQTQMKLHLQHQFGLSLPSVCRERSLLAKPLFLG